jgi:iron complex transport system permease protein
VLKLTTIILVLILINIGLFICHISSGIFSINIIDYLCSHTSHQENAILESIRFPRAICAILVGSALAVSGALLQGTFRNPLASSGIIGTDSGAMLGAIIAIFFGITAPSTIGIFAFVIATIVTFIVYFLSFNLHSKRSDLVYMILAGVGISALCTGISSIFLSISLEDWDMGKRMVMWGFGSLEHTTWSHIKILAPTIILGLLLTIPFLKDLNLLSLGNEIAQSLGVKLERTRFLVIILSSLLAGIVVSITGMIGFVGLVCPHIVRLLFGNNYLKLIPISALMGAAFLLASDSVVLFLKSNYKVDLKIGILTSLIGAPFFLSLLMKRKYT